MKGSLQAEQTQHQRITKDVLEVIARKPYSAEYAECYAAFAQFSKHIPTGSRVLEFGCADGWLVGMLSQRGCSCVGVDCNTEWLDMARKNWPLVDFQVGNWESYYPGYRFDVVVWNGSLHHALNIRRALSVSFNACRPGGLLLVNEPGLGHTLRPFTRAWHRLTGVTEIDTPPYRTIYHAWKSGWRKPVVYPALSTMLKVNAALTIALSVFKCAHGFVKMTKP